MGVVAERGRVTRGPLRRVQVVRLLGCLVVSMFA